MHLVSSIRSLALTVAEDFRMARLGAPLGWLLRLHYGGRWGKRRNGEPAIQRITLDLGNGPLHMELSAPYEGALKGIFLDREYDCASLLRPPTTILDVGANIGMSALYFSSLFPEASFVCVEPDPRNVSLLERNLQANRLRARIERCAVSPIAGSLTLRFGDNPTCSALETSPMHTLDQQVSVRVKTIVELLQEVGWENVDLLKLDIEGSEEELLARNNTWLERVGALVLEIHPNTTPEKIGACLRPFGFELRRIGWKVEPVYFASRRL